MTRFNKKLITFNAGELSPLMNERIDQDKYASGCRTLENFFPLIHGGVEKRPGTEFVIETKTSSLASRLVAFERSVDTAYMLEFGNQYIRVHTVTISKGGGAFPGTEKTAPYLAADLFELKFEHSNDVMWITHPAYEPRKLSRTSATTWVLSVVERNEGPFRDQNTDESLTIAVKTYTIDAVSTSSDTFTISDDGDLSAMFTDGTVFNVVDSTGNDAEWTVSSTSYSSPDFVITVTGDITDATVDGTIEPDITKDGVIQLTASGALFNSGHAPAGSAATSVSTTGAFFKISQIRQETEVTANLSSVTNSSTISVLKGMKWDYITNGIWWGTVKLQRSYDSGSTWENIHTTYSQNNDNSQVDGEETFADALYRVRMTSRTEGTANIKFAVRSALYEGIVRIDSFSSSILAQATVIKTISSVDSTYRWSEGSWSDYRGWPATVAISPDERLTFAGSIAEPLTIWQSKAGQFTEFLRGDLDADAIIHTLIGSGKQNQINWMVATSALVLGTEGGEHRYGATKLQEPVTPTNVNAKVQSTYGSANVQALVINDAILYVQKGGERLLEMVDTIQKETLVSDELTTFARHIAEGGIVDMAYQRTPAPIVYCVRSDGVLLAMLYNRAQEVFSWCRIVTDGSFESVAVLSSTTVEEEVWVIVNRTINGSTVRYLETFAARNFGTAKEDAYYVDCGVIYDSTATTEFSGLDHLEGESAAVYGDRTVVPNETVASGAVSIDRSSAVVHIGLPFTATLKPVKIDDAMGLIQRIKTACLRFYRTLGAKVGNGTNTPTEVIFHDTSQVFGAGPTLFTGEKEVPFEGGYEREGSIEITSDTPVPCTVLGMILEMDASRK